MLRAPFTSSCKLNSIYTRINRHAILGKDFWRSEQREYCVSHAGSGPRLPFSEMHVLRIFAGVLANRRHSFQTQEIYPQ